MPENTRDILLSEIDLHPENMRSDIDRDSVFELGMDIQKNGLINPITVRPKGARFELVAGQRRLLAHRFKGMAKIRAIVRELSDDEAFGIMTSENLARVDVNLVDEAMHVKRLVEKSGGDLNHASHVLNRGKEWVATRLLIAAMPPDLLEPLRTGIIKQGVALALAEITDETDRAACIAMAISQGASVVVAQYWSAQWRAGLFGHAVSVLTPDLGVDGVQRNTVMLRCAVDGKMYPATEMESVLVAKFNVGYIHAMREHLTAPASVLDSAGGGNRIEPEGEAVAEPV